MRGTPDRQDVCADAWLSDARTIVTNRPVGRDGIDSRSVRGRVADSDWSATPLGPVSFWSPALQTAADVVLAAVSPAFVHWGDEQRIVYNDASRGILVNIHPWALGRPGAEVWGDAWGAIGASILAAKKGRAGVAEDVHFPNAGSRPGNRRDGRVFRFESSPIREADGSVGGVFTITAESTARIAAETRAAGLETDLVVLRAREERFRRAFFEGPIGMALMAPTKRPIEVNAALCTMLGYAREELQKTTWETMTSPEDLPSEVLEFDRVIAGESDSYSLRKRWIRKDGGVIHTLVSARCVRSPDRSVEYLIMLVQDMTLTVRAHDAALRAQADAADVGRSTALGELAADIAHKMNQPLGTLVNNAHICQRLLAKGGSLAAIDDALRDMIAAANRASAVMNQIGNLTQRNAAVREVLPVQDVLARVLTLAKPRIVDAGVSLRVDIGLEKMSITADRSHLQQLFLNLIVNAVEAIDDSSIARRVLVVRARPAKLDEAPAVEIAVSDSGRGFAPGENSQLFETFYTTKPHRMGMGLRISRSIAEAHGGRIRAECSPGRGATFYCTLPMAI